MEGVRAAELAIDRPSTKFLSFLRKHYRLHSDVKQVSPAVEHSALLLYTVYARYSLLSRI